jgi:4-hydroxybenzoate polyprenyltransferase
MDLTDLEGDRAAGIKTLPVMIGQRGALLAATCCVLAGAAAALASATAAWGPRAAAARAAVVVLATARLGQLSFGILKSGFDRAVMGSAIEESLKPVGLCLILLSALAP